MNILLQDNIENGQQISQLHHYHQIGSYGVAFWKFRYENGKLQKEKKCLTLVFVCKEHARGQRKVSLSFKGYIEACLKERASYLHEDRVDNKP